MEQDYFFLFILFILGVLPEKKNQSARVYLCSWVAKKVLVEEI